MAEEEQEEQRLIERAVSGDRAAFGALVGIFYPRIFRIAYKWCGNKMDAEDIAQDVCIKLGSAIRKFEGNASFSSWVYRITLNTVRDLQRSNKSHENKVSAMALVSEEVFAADQESELTRSQVWQRVTQLPDKQREAVFLIHSEGLSHKEASDVMECSESTVSWYIHEAKKQLKSLLGADQVAI